MPQKIQPMGLVGSREAISAPTVGYASESTPVSTARPGPSLSSLSPGGRGTSTVKKSSKRASAMSATHTTHSDQATNAAVRGLIQLTPRFCSLAPYITTPLYSTTVSQALRQTLRAGVPRTISARTTDHEDMVVAPRIWREDTSRLTSFSIDDEHTSDTLSERRESILPPSVAILNKEGTPELSQGIVVPHL